MNQAFQRALEIAVAFFLCALMLLTGADVAARYFFNRPIPGAFELIEMLMGAIVYIGLVLTTVRRDHIAVDLVDKRISPPALGGLKRVNDLLSGVIVAISALGVAWQAQSIYQSDLHSSILGIPLWPAAAVVTFLVAATAFFFLLHAGQRQPQQNPQGAHR